MKAVFTKKAHKQLLKLPRSIHSLIVEKIISLGIDQAGLNTRKLTNRVGFRLRVGDYRVIYITTAREIVILSVTHRKDAYRK